MAETAKVIRPEDEDVKGTRGLETEIEVVTPSDKPETESVIESEAAPVKETTEADLVSIKERMDVAEKARKEADERATQAREELERANQRLTQEKGSRFAAQESAIANALVAAESEGEQAEQQYAAAAQNQDWNAAGKAQRVMAAAEAKKLQLESSRQTVEQWKKQASEERDPLEQQYPDPRVRAWIKDHPQFLNDPVYRAEAIAAHTRAVRDGISIGSNEYFKAIEDRVIEKPKVQNRMGLRLVETEEEPVAEETEAEAKPKVEAKPKAKVSSAAPPSRGGPSPTGNQREKVALTEQEVEFALYNSRETLTFPGEKNVSDAEILRRYAKNKSDLKKEGKWL